MITSSDMATWIKARLAASTAVTTALPGGVWQFAAHELAGAADYPDQNNIGSYGVFTVAPTGESEIVVGSSWALTVWRMEFAAYTDSNPTSAATGRAAVMLALADGSLWDTTIALRDGTVEWVNPTAPAAEMNFGETRNANDSIICRHAVEFGTQGTWRS